MALLPIIVNVVTVKKFSTTLGRLLCRTRLCLSRVPIADKGRSLAQHLLIEECPGIQHMYFEKKGIGHNISVSRRKKAKWLELWADRLGGEDDVYDKKNGSALSWSFRSDHLKSVSLLIRYVRNTM